MIVGLIARVALVLSLISVVMGGVAVAHAEPVAGVNQATALNSYQIKFSYTTPDGKRKITTTVVQAKTMTEAQRQVKDTYQKVNVITVKRLK